MRNLILLIAGLVCHTLFGFPKQPSYFILGQEEFKGVQIYDVIQDKDDNYIFSTNEGLVYYDHYSYQKIVCRASRSSSYFYFTENSKGDIFCINLNRQVFKITGKECEVFFEVSENEANAFMGIAVTGNDEVIVACNVVFLMDNDGNIIKKLDRHLGICGTPYELINGDVIFSLGADSLIVYHNHDLHYEKLIIDPADLAKNELLYFFEIGGKLFGVKNLSNKVFTIDYRTKVVKPVKADNGFSQLRAIRIYRTSEHVWLGGTLPGVFILKLGKSSILSKQYYPNHYISDVYEDHENNIILSTFDQGALVIPDMNMPDNFVLFQDEPITCLQKINDEKLIFGTSKGKVGLIEGDEIQIIQNVGNRPINKIIATSSNDHIIYDDGIVKAHNVKTRKTFPVVLASLKDGIVLNNGDMLLATNGGLIEVRITTDHHVETKNIPELDFRNYAVTSNSDETIIYVSTLNGLFSYEQGKVGEIKYHDESIFSSHLVFNKGLLYAVNAQSQIYVIEKNKVVQKFRTEINNQPVNIYEMKFISEKVYINSSKGLLVHNTKTRRTQMINSRFGIPKRRMLDFEIQSNNLWVSGSDMFKKIDLHYPGRKITAPKIKLDKVLLNDKPLQDLKTRFSSDERKVAFVLSVPTLTNKNDITYHYQLNGFENKWNSNTYFNNTITYNSLPSGDFNFKVYALRGNQRSNMLSYRFSIDYPFYQRFWFIGLCVTVFLFVVFAVYRKQLQIQKTKARQQFELNASKLTAIQSQMNPHFIFNSLNSIQDLVLKGDIEHSYSYITTFSNLVRRTLNYSDKDFIDFEQEIKLLELYLSLEKLRFKNELNFELNTGKITEIQIPPMLIQPFIENALVHGLLHKKGDKNLSITFSLDESLYCIIRDNGIGRKKAGEIQKRQKKGHESFAVKAIRKRFEILSDYYHGEIGYWYKDLTENGESVGTEVTLKIPYKVKF